MVLSTAFINGIKEFKSSDDLVKQKLIYNCIKWCLKEVKLLRFVYINDYYFKFISRGMYLKGSATMFYRMKTSR